MNQKYLAKFKESNEHQCICCKHYLTCLRIRAGDNCFELHDQIYADLNLLYPDYFFDRKKAALKILEV